MSVAANFSAESISRPVMNVIVSGVSGFAASGLIAMQAGPATIFCATNEIIKEIFDKAAHYLLPISTWNRETHQNSLTLLNFSFHIGALVGSLAITALVTSVALPVFDSIFLLILSGILGGGTSLLIDILFGPASRA